MDKQIIDWLKFNSLPINSNDTIAISDSEYTMQLSGNKLMSDFSEYEKITGKNWGDSLIAFDPVSRSIEKFHKEVVLPLLSA